MAEPESDLAARIATIKQEFLARLKDDWVPSLRNLRRRFVATPEDAGLRNEMLHAAHDMTGSGAIFGYDDISHHGRRLDDSLRRLIKGEVEDTPERRQEIIDLIDELDRVCVAALSDLTQPTNPPRA